MSTETGGTVVSTAFEEMLRVVAARYPRDQWNIYAAQASDGDNVSERQCQGRQPAEAEDPAALPVFRLYRGARTQDGRDADHRSVAHL